MEVSRVSDQPEGPPVEHYLKARAGGAPLDAPLNGVRLFTLT